MTTHKKEVPLKVKRTVQELETEMETMQFRLEEAEETLRAIRNNEVDALVVDGPQGQQVFTLQGAEQPYRILMETMPEGALTIAPNGAILFSNNRFSEMVSIPLNNIIGVSIHDFVISPDGPSFKSTLRKCGKQGCGGEFFLKPSHGGKIPVSVSVGSLTFSGVEGFCLVITDLTKQKQTQEELEKAQSFLEEKVVERTSELSQANAMLHGEIQDRERAEQALREHQRLFQDVIDSSPSAIFLKDLDGKFITINRRLETMLGITREKLKGKTDYDIAPKETADYWQSHDMQVMNTGLPLQIEEMADLQDGHHVFLANKFPLVSASGQIYGVGAISHDITDRKQAEETLRKAHEELELQVEERTMDLKYAYGKLLVETEERQRAEEHLVRVQKLEALGTLASGIAHDFNNILAGILGFTEMVYEDLIPDSPEHKRLGLVLKGAQRGRDLVKQILAFSRQSEPDKKPVSVNEIVEEGIKLLRPMLPSTIEIVTVSLTTDDRILADPAQIYQILMNLCTNAAHAMREKGGLLELRISKVDFSDEDPLPFSDMAPGQYVIFGVHDTGMGMIPETIDRIFDPFFTTKKQGEGTGLGLSVVHGIVQNHDGYVRVESEPGKGTTFYVYLPKVNGQAFAEDREVPGVTRGNERILFVDDEDMLVALNEQRLARLGYDVVATTSSMDALDIFRKDPDAFDLVITDYTMPNMTGVDLAMELLKVKPTTLIILCTGDSDPVTRERTQESGIKAFLTKPLAKSELAQVIRRVLGDKQASH
jgi:PAS domain S-box-containing protein